MKVYRTVFFAGWLAMSGAIASVAAAECGPPSEEEMTTQQAAIFAEADADKSKTLSLNEFAMFIKLFEATRAERHFKCLDTNGDGQVSSDELAAHRPPHGRHHPPLF